LAAPLDAVASKAPVADPFLQDNTARYDPARSNQSVASPATGGEGAPQVGSDPAESGDEHGVRGRTGRSEEAGGGTRQPATATRFINTALRRLSYAALAGHLAERVAAVEVEVERGSFPFEPIHEALIVSLHHAICADLVPDYVGWHESPPPEWLRASATRACAEQLASAQSPRLPAQCQRAARCAHSSRPNYGCRCVQ